MQELYKNPHNGYISTITGGSILCSFLFGWIYFAFKGAWLMAIVNFLLAVVTGGISWFIFPFFTRKILRDYYAQKGWIRIEKEANA